MEKEEIFRIFDACRPTVAQVREYLERISGVSPFDLIFFKDGKEIITKKIAPNMGELVGVVVDKTIFYVKPMTFDEVKDLPMPVTTEVVFDFGKKIHVNAKPIDEFAMNVFAANSHNFLRLSDMLAVFGYDSCFNQDKYLLIAKNDGEHTGQYWYRNLGEFGLDGETDIAHFLESYGNIYFYASIQ